MRGGVGFEITHLLHHRDPVAERLVAKPLRRRLEWYVVDPGLHLGEERRQRRYSLWGIKRSVRALILSSLLPCMYNSLIHAIPAQHRLAGSIP